MKICNEIGPEKLCSFHPHLHTIPCSLWKRHCIAPSIHVFKAKLLNNLKIDRRHWKQIAMLFFSLDDGCKEAASGIMQMFNWVSTCKMTEAQHATGLWYISSDETSKWKSVVGSCEGDRNMENIFPEQLNNFTLFWYNRYWCSAWVSSVDNYAAINLLPRIWLLVLRTVTY